MITQSGVRIQKSGGVEGTPTAMDIAVHAGRICRFGGAVWYPLLPHLVFVGLMAYRRSRAVENLLWGFLHDAHEVVTSDVPRPFKCDCMRAEQKAIDERISRQFMSGLRFKPDHNLIKQCDTDALHIEAIELKILGFADIELQYAADYTNRAKIHDNKADKELFWRILESPFGDYETIKGMYSGGVIRFCNALSFAELDDYNRFIKSVIGWGLLEEFPK